MASKTVKILLSHGTEALLLFPSHLDRHLVSEPLLSTLCQASVEAVYVVQCLTT